MVADLCRAAVLFIMFSMIPALWGCAEKPSRMEHSGFLEDYSGLHPNPNRRGGEIYIRPGVDFPRYDKIIIEPVELYLTPEARSRDLSPEHMEEMAKQFRRSLESALKDTYAIVDEPGPGVMRLRAAITDINPKQPVGLTSRDGRSGLRITTPDEKADVVINVGSTAMEMEITDANTGERLAAAVDRKGGAVGAEGPTPSKTKAVFDYWAKAVLNHLERLREKR